MPAPDVLVVGAGIVGAACAEALTAAGLSVEILESRFAGGGATAAAMGHLVVMDDSEAQFALTALSRRLWAEIAPEIPRDCEDEETGVVLGTHCVGHLAHQCAVMSTSGIDSTRPVKPN